MESDDASITAQELTDPVIIESINQDVTDAVEDHFDEVLSALVLIDKAIDKLKSLFFSNELI